MVLDWGELHPWMQGLHQLRGLLRRLLVLKLRAVVRGGWRGELGRLAYAQRFGRGGHGRGRGDAGIGYDRSTSGD